LLYLIYPMSDITGNINRLHKQIPSFVKVVAVSKTRNETDILEAYNTGQRLFGENRVQELLSKKDSLPSDIEWHLIGHLQSNKVKLVVPFVSMIHSVDTFKLLRVIDSEAKKTGKPVDCLLQFYIASEETKFGFSMNEVTEMLESKEFLQLSFVRIRGLMGMATFTPDMTQVRKEFRYLADCFKLLKNKYFLENPLFSEISMGMSGDYNIAIEEGSTIIRVGSIIFGERT
jgi:pyridoxal phosphate enzyme (YggS family)